MGMEPVDMDAVDRMGAETAAQSEEGAQNIGGALRNLFGGGEGRTAAFAQGALAGRALSTGAGARAIP